MKKLFLPFALLAALLSVLALGACGAEEQKEIAYEGVYRLVSVYVLGTEHTAEDDLKPEQATLELVKDGSLTFRSVVPFCAADAHGSWRAGERKKPEFTLIDAEGNRVTLTAFCDGERVTFSYQDATFTLMKNKKQ